ncbi:MAG TPA: hypothetical protein VEF06_13295 [Bryobacteraceae bacterium]|nr:hypothetical protein [Bryobacteraceae bacterium]
MRKPLFRSFGTGALLSAGQLLAQSPVLEEQLGHNGFQTLVLVFDLPQGAGLGGAIPVPAKFPAIEGSPGDAVPAADFLEWHALVKFLQRLGDQLLVMTFTTHVPSLSTRVHSSCKQERVRALIQRGFLLFSGKSDRALKRELQSRIFSCQDFNRVPQRYVLTNGLLESAVAGAVLELSPGSPVF